MRSIMPLLVPYRELKNIRSEVGSLTEISEGLEQEMEKFKISG